MVRALLILGFGACAYAPGTPLKSDGGLGSDDGRHDAPSVTCFGSHVSDRVCLSAHPASSVTLPATINTSVPSMCAAQVVSGPDACVIAADQITISTTTKVTGTRPLILIGVTSITIPASGILDAASHPGSPGPAANVGCVPVAGAAGAGGGVGGSFQGHGGAGGDSAVTPAGVVVPATLTGGCPGGAGGGTGTFGVGGAGGGAVALISESIAIAGTINASGMHGLAGDTGNQGGGGGGAGGMIVLDTVDLIGMGVVMANGGPGAGGSSVGSGQHGDPGLDPGPTGWSTPASGGTGNNGAAGGDGSAGNPPPGGTGALDGTAGSPSTSTNGGGGGGGGGAGLVKLYRVTSFLSGNVSPPLL